LDHRLTPVVTSSVDRVALGAWCCGKLAGERAGDGIASPRARNDSGGEPTGAASADCAWAWLIASPAAGGHVVAIGGLGALQVANEEV